MNQYLRYNFMIYICITDQDWLNIKQENLKQN